MFDNDIKITGKYATYLKFISKKNAEKNAETIKPDGAGKETKIAEIFNRYIDVYIAGAIIGAVKNCKADVDTSSSDTANILASAVIREQDKLKFLYHLVLLTDDPTVKPEDRIDRAFRYDEDADKVKEGMAIFNSYARGGIKWLYEQIIDGATAEDDYLRRVQEIVSEYKMDYYEEEN